MTSSRENFDAFLSHSHDDAEWVESLAKRLEDDCRFRIWLDKWVLVPGKSWQQEMAKGLDTTSTCVVCIGANPPQGWFQEEIERALEIQTRNPNFRVIPVLLPNARPEFVPAFLSLRTWADFRTGHNMEYAFYILKKGILGEPPGRWPEETNPVSSEGLKSYEKKILELRQLHGLGIKDEIVFEFQRKILDRWLDDK